MCVRFTQADDAMEEWKLVRGRWERTGVSWPAPRPRDLFSGNMASFVVQGADGPTWRHGRWGFDIRGLDKLAHHARSETIAKLPTFKEAFRSRRCVIPALAFYEQLAGHWQRLASPNGDILLMAGIWNEDPLSFTIATCIPNDVVAPVQDRMPVLLDEGGTEAWLSNTTSVAELHDLMVPAPSHWLFLEQAESNRRRRTPELDPKATRPGQGGLFEVDGRI